MTSRLDWCPIGVRKVADAPIATAMRKGSRLTPRPRAMPMPIGAMSTEVAALFMTSESSMVKTMTTASTAQRGALSGR